MSTQILKLQNDIFDQSDEKILYIVHCFKHAPEKKHSHHHDHRRKRKDAYLCIVNDVSQAHPNISICEVKALADKPQDPWKRKRTWALRELKSINGKYDTGSPDQEDESLEFELEFEKVFCWEAANEEEKKKFLSNLIKLTSQNIRNKVAVKNVPASVLEDEFNLSPEGDKASWALAKDEADNVYQIMNDKETSDLLALINKCDFAVTNADKFVEDLRKELNVLDGANVHSVMASEENIDNLMDLIDKAINEAESHESRLNQYDDLLEHIRDSMEKMEGKTMSIETVNSNNKSLMELLDNIITQLEIPYHYQQLLMEADFSQSQSLGDVIEAAQALQRAMTCEIDPSVMKLSAVQDQRKRCERWRDKFSKSIYRHLNNMFIHLSNEGGDSLEVAVGELRLARRRRIHQELVLYSELMHWMKAMDDKSFVSLQMTYRSSLCKLYEKDIRRFFETARYRVSGGKPVTSVSASTQDVSGRKSRGLLGADTDSIGSELSLSERERFDDVLETILLELEAVCQDEQNFSTRFFQMAELGQNPDPKREKQITEEARKMMADIFPTLESELTAFIAFYEKGDSFFTMHALVKLSKHVLPAQDKGSFLAISLGSVLIIMKRNFDKFMQMQQRSIEDAKAPRKNKCAILAFISNFEAFVSTTENIFRTSERRVDLEKWYGILVNEMFNSINRISKEHGKTPEQVVKMENFHHLHSLLAQMKIPVLDNHKKEAKQRYQDAQKAYVIQYFGRPLEKLNVFFDGIQQLVSAGVKESEISYQLAYSKQELRKVISIYPGREVKKGLDNLYKKVERHLCDEENLVQVVWRAMQEEFIQQYKCIEDLIERCYPGSQIALDFTITDVLQYFSDIAQSH